MDLLGPRHGTPRSRFETYALYVTGPIAFPPRNDPCTADHAIPITDCKCSYAMRNDRAMVGDPEKNYGSVIDQSVLMKKVNNIGDSRESALKRLRGIERRFKRDNPYDLIDAERWWNGPEFLKWDEEHWPPSLLAFRETFTALDCIFRAVQQRAFYCKYEALIKNEIVNTSSNILSLSPFLDESGLISWNFIPPNAPHFGDLWEAAVKSVKYYMTRILGKAHLTFEEMQTTLCEIEAILNSRPLLPLSVDPNDLAYLSPEHFLVDTTLNSLPCVDLNDVNENKLLRWQRVEQIQLLERQRRKGFLYRIVTEDEKWIHYDNPKRKPHNIPSSPLIPRRTLGTTLGRPLYLFRSGPAWSQLYRPALQDFPASQRGLLKSIIAIIIIPRETIHEREGYFERCYNLPRRPPPRYVDPRPPRAITHYQA
ncbi:hypothetical protein ALC53_12570 [Atta colombica]|uniref:Uncharacterized protein n=1 Tax=Atta colombica TaxID=520822 RepID=A0A195AYJ4_9HYME|nr:hypothetical protein ALC53_12570 [Atta colombica]